MIEPLNIKITCFHCEEYFHWVYSEDILKKNIIECICTHCGCMTPVESKRIRAAIDASPEPTLADNDTRENGAT